MSDAIDVTAVLARAAAIMAEQRDALCALDAELGDGDIGLTMSKGFAAAGQAAAGGADRTPSGTLKAAAFALMSAAPSTMGTLIAGGFLAASKAAAGMERVDAPGLAKILRAFADGIAARGKSRRGDKTILDALYPALDALEAAEPGTPLEATLERMAAAAREGAEATRDMQAKHGRAGRYLEGSVGHVDAGARVGAYFMDAFR